MSEAPSRPWGPVLRSALTWGAAWALAGGAIVALLTLVAPGPGVESLPERLGMALFGGISWGVRFGIAGAVIGTVFASAIRLSYRGRRLAQIDPARFTLVGAVSGGIGVPLYLQLMNVLTGGSLIAWGLVGSDAVLGTVFGAAVAGGSILLARRAEARSPAPEPESIDAVGSSGDRLTAGPMDPAASELSSRAEEQRIRC